MTKTKMHNWKFNLLIVSIMALLPLSALAASHKVVVNFGIGPQQSAIELAKRWTPILAYLSDKTGYDIQFTTSKDIPTYQRQATEGVFDMCFINPYHYTLFNKSAGYQAFAQQKDAQLTGVVVVRKDSAYRSMKDLHEKDLAFPAKTAVTAAVLPLQHLQKLGAQVTPHYVVSHDSVYRTVAKGLYAAGGGELRTFETMEPAVRGQLRILWTASPLPAFLFAAHPRVPEDVARRVAEAMIHMDQDPEGRELLKAINFKGIAPAKDADYDVVRRLELRMPE